MPVPSFTNKRIATAEAIARIGLEPQPLSRAIDDLAAHVAAHPVLDGLCELDKLRVYMEYHVWCVWDFMALLRGIQVQMCPPTPAWVPSSNPRAIRSFYLIMSNEETDDQLPGGRIGSHFEAYVAAMEELGARTEPVRQFLDLLQRRNKLPEVALREAAGIPAACAEHVRTTLRLARGSLAQAAGALCFGRELLIPTLFERVLASVAENPAPDLKNAKSSQLRWYLQRHIYLDTTDHGPKSVELLASVLNCSKDMKSTGNEALQAGIDALTARLNLMNALPRSSR